MHDYDQSGGSVAGPPAPVKRVREQVVGHVDRSPHSEAGRRLPPSPGGEGWGEGSSPPKTQSDPRLASRHVDPHGKSHISCFEHVPRCKACRKRSRSATYPTEYIARPRPERRAPASASRTFCFESWSERCRARRLRKFWRGSPPGNVHVCLSPRRKSSGVNPSGGDRRRRLGGRLNVAGPRESCGERARPSIRAAS